MLQLRYRFIQALRNRSGIFWGLFFPLALGTLFYLSFGGLGKADPFEPVPTAVVGEENEFFTQMLGQLDGGILEVRQMDQEEAVQALEDGDVTGIYTNAQEPSLEVAGSGFGETVLSGILKEYMQYDSVIRDMSEKHPERIPAFIEQIGSDTRTYVENTSLGGKSFDETMEYFFALIAMACFFGCFMGQRLGEESAANISPLAARRAVSPRSKLLTVLTDMFVGFVIQFASVLVLLFYLNYVLQVHIMAHFGEMLLVAACGSLLGVSAGIFIGSMAVRPGVKAILTTAVPLALCFMAGLMYGNMKQIIDAKAPIVNRLNPAALISDALYYLNIYEDQSAFMLRIVLLAAWSVGMAFLAFIRLRRERYVSI